ncbi:MAG TPA: hypothetical protein VJG83_04435 [archaeon]|nr:hypothetical protein [archaeon]
MDEKLRSNIFHLIILSILIIALIGVLVFTGIVGCGIVPGGCELYYTIAKGGSPRVLIAYGDGGMGDHEKLFALFNEKDILNARVESMDIDRLTYGNVRDYDLIIVEDAKKICTDKLRIFQYYINYGGRLVWTADSGSELCINEPSGRYPQSDSYLLDKERNEGGFEMVIGPLARKDGDRQLSFDRLLGVQYRGNYCEFFECTKPELSGYVQVTNTSHKLTYGLSPSIPFHGDFAITELSKSENARVVAVLDYGTDLLAKAKNQPWLESGKTYNFGKSIPLIVASGVGERVVYYAVPIEAFVSDEQPQKNRAIVEQMYYGMLYN